MARVHAGQLAWLYWKWLRSANVTQWKPRRQWTQRTKQWRGELYIILMTADDRNFLRRRIGQLSSAAANLQTGWSST